MTIAVFVNQEALDNIPSLPSGVVIGIPVTSQDGRVIICHEFIEEDLRVLRNSGAEIRVDMPEDWVYPDNDK